MGGGSGGGGRSGRGSGGGGAAHPGDSPLTAALRSSYEPGGATVQQLPLGSVQVTHPKATIRIGNSGAEVWSSREPGQKAFKPSAPVKYYKDPVKGLAAFEKITGMIT